MIKRQDRSGKPTVCTLTEGSRLEPWVVLDKVKRGRRPTLWNSVREKLSCVRSPGRKGACRHPLCGWRETQSESSRTHQFPSDKSGKDGDSFERRALHRLENRLYEKRVPGKSKVQNWSQRLPFEIRKYLLKVRSFRPPLLKNPRLLRSYTYKILRWTSSFLFFWLYKKKVSPFLFKEM